jgi:hypothetical protein
LEADEHRQMAAEGSLVVVIVVRAMLGGLRGRRER